MSIVTIDSNVRQKLEHALNAKIPGPDDEAFEGFVESLRLAHPELHRELLQGIKVDAKMPVETAVKRAAWRNRLRETVNRLFYQKQWPDDLVLDKKRVMFAGLGTLMLLLPVAFLLSGSFTGATGGTDVSPPQPIEEVLTPSETAQPSEQAAPLVPERSSSEDEPSSEPVERQVAASTNDARTPVPPESLSQTSTSSNPFFTAFPTTSPPPPRSNQVPASFTNQSSEPALPTQLTVATSPPRPETLAVWQNEASGAVPGSVSLPGLPQSPPGSDMARLQISTVFTRPFEEPPTTTVYMNVDSTPETALPLSVTVSNSEGQVSTDSGSAQNNEISSQQTERSRLTLYTQGRNAEPSSPVSPTVFSQNQAGMVEEISAPATDVATEGSDTQLSAGTASTVQTGEAAPQPGVLLQPGDRIPATLATGIVIAENTSVPVIAETKGDWCGIGSCPEITWIGEATLSANDRVEVSFSQAVIGGELKSISGFALSDDTLSGLPASSQDMSATAAQDLLKSAVGGVSDYVNALANQKRLVFQGDSVIQEGQVPGIESFILGRVAGLLALPETQTPSVRVASVPIGTPLIVLYGVGRN